MSEFVILFLSLLFCVVKEYKNPFAGFMGHALKGFIWHLEPVLSHYRKTKPCSQDFLPALRLGTGWSSQPDLKFDSKPMCREVE